MESAGAGLGMESANLAALVLTEIALSLDIFETPVDPENRRREKQAEWDKTYMTMAQLIAGHSHDPKFKVGAIVVNDMDGTVAGMGYNGRGKGRPNDRFSMETGQSGFVHAEMNAIARVSWQLACTYTLYTTLSPCVVCAGLVLNNPIKRVVYAAEYPGDEGLKEITLGLGVSNVVCCPHHE